MLLSLNQTVTKLYQFWFRILFFKNWVLIIIGINRCIHYSFNGKQQTSAPKNKYWSINQIHTGLFWRICTFCFWCRNKFDKKDRVREKRFSKAPSISESLKSVECNTLNKINWFNSFNFFFFGFFSSRKCVSREWYDCVTMYPQTYLYWLMMHIVCFTNMSVCLDGRQPSGCGVIHKNLMFKSMVK